MIIYIEGVDGSGKSTLKGRLLKRLEQIKDLHNIKIYPEGETLIPTHPSKANRLSREDLFKQLSKMANDPNTVYICDRGPLSDIIYRAFDDYKPLVSLEELLWFWGTQGIMIVTVHCVNDRSEELMKERGEENPVAIQYHKALKYIYNQIMPLFGAINYDFSVESDEKLSSINTILARLWAGRNKFNQLQEAYLKTIKNVN